MKRTWIPIIGGVFCIAAGFLISFHVFQIKAIRDDKIVFLHIVHPGAKFATKYIHSVEKSPVWEYFVVDGQFRIVLYETTFVSCNTGLPCVILGNEEFCHEGDRFRISRMNRILPVLLLWVHDRYDNTLYIGESQYLSLPSLSGNTLLRITIEKMKLIEFIYKRLCLIVEHEIEEHLPSLMEGA